MSEKFQPGEEMFDEVEGHGRVRAVADDESTEGHRIKFKTAPDDEETEGHMPRMRFPVAEDAEDAEGHARRI